MLPQQGCDLAERQPHLLVEDDGRRHQSGAQLHGGGAESIGGLQPMPTPHPPAAILTSAEGDPRLPDEDSRDRQFFLELGGHAGRAHSSAAIRTARRQRHVVTDVHPGWSAPAGRLAVLGAGSPAWAFGFGLDGLGEGSRLAATGPSRCIELSFQAGVLPLEPFDWPLQPFTLTLASLRARASRARAPPGSVGGRPARGASGAYPVYRHLCNSVPPQRQRPPPPSTSRTAFRQLPLVPTR